MRDSRFFRGFLHIGLCHLWIEKALLLPFNLGTFYFFFMIARPQYNVEWKRYEPVSLPYSWYKAVVGEGGFMFFFNALIMWRMFILIPRLLDVLLWKHARFVKVFFSASFELIMWDFVVLLMWRDQLIFMCCSIFEFPR